MYIQIHVVCSVVYVHNTLYMLYYTVHVCSVVHVRNTCYTTCM